MKSISLSAARRIALEAQGFGDNKPSSKVDIRNFRRVMNQMTVLQLDSVNALCRSHYLPALSRLGPYDRDKFDSFLYQSGENFEYLSHEASITSQKLHPLLRWRMKQNRWGKNIKPEAEVPKYVQAVLQQVKDRGPLSVKDLKDPGPRTGPWWGQSKGKVALERLYVSGKICIRGRNNMFVTEYDLAEKIIKPEIINLPNIPVEEAYLGLTRLAIRSLGVGTAKDIADYFRLKVKDVHPCLEQLTKAGEIKTVLVEGWKEQAYLHSEAKIPRKISTRALLSPFDPVVWFRPRAERLFNFRYRIEIYVPEPKRIYGYYVLPFLLDDQLVARVDLKADRHRKVLMVKAAYSEDKTNKSRVASELNKSLQEMADWLGLDEIEIADKGDLAGHLI